MNLVVFNDVSRADIGFDAEENEVSLIARQGSAGEQGAEGAVAAAILDEVARLLEEADGRAVA